MDGKENVELRGSFLSQYTYIKGKMGNGTIRETVEDDNLTRQFRAIRTKDKGKDDAAKM